MTRVRQPLRRVGASTARWALWRSLSYAQADARVIRRGGGCEGCTAIVRPLDHHHIFGRKDEPWSSLPECLACLCRGCHVEVTEHRNRDLEVRLKQVALVGLRTRFGLLDLPPEVDDFEGTIRAARAAGWEWDAQRCRLVRG